MPSCYTSALCTSQDRKYQNFLVTNNNNQPDRIQSTSAPYRCTGVVGLPEGAVASTLRSAEAGIWRLYSTRPSCVILGSCRLESLAWTALRTPWPRSKWVSRSSMERMRGAALEGPMKAAKMATHSWLAWRTRRLGSTRVGTTVAAMFFKSNS